MLALTIQGQRFGDFLPRGLCAASWIDRQAGPVRQFGTRGDRAATREAHLGPFQNPNSRGAESQPEFATRVVRIS